MKQSDFSENDIIIYLRSRNLSSVAVFVIDIVKPFSGILAFIITISTPVLNIFFKSDNIDPVLFFFENESQIKGLRNKLLEKN